MHGGGKKPDHVLLVSVRRKPSLVSVMPFISNMSSYCEQLDILKVITTFP